MLLSKNVHLRHNLNRGHKQERRTTIFDAYHSETMITREIAEPKCLESYKRKRTTCNNFFE